ncbi:conserved exported protein of unknown function [Nitrosopumilus adriaticus]|uniref:Uncharacterized protein n=1 Tax=Nitrosopumilus adriaticus TaxID=1580092 RepID=A0A0D5C303_9ARCH|nr:conserved exported protein of unknown function [Nitrosopumilus adriaticus]
MFLQWKLIFQKISLKNLFLFALLILFILVLLSFTGNSCGIQHMLILNDIFSYEKSLDPELCEIIVEKIDSFNDSCEPEIEILDCS